MSAPGGTLLRVTGGPDRRTVLRGGLVGAAGLALGGLDVHPARVRRAAAATRTGTTLAATVLRGPAGAGGYRRLVTGPGEPHVVRADLGAAPRAGRETRRRGVVAFAHLTDVHVLDAESPARVEYLDRYNDGPGSSLIFASAYRPQEALTGQTSDALVRAVRAVRAAPVSGLPLSFAVCTGDNTDNAQLNEVRWSIDLLDGTRVAIASGDPTRYEGVQDGDPATYDVHYWHPDGTPDSPVAAAAGDDDARRLQGFPVVPGLLAAAGAPFEPVGLPFPWYTCFGNHDGLVQGNFPRSFQLTVAATGPAKVVGVPAGASPDDVARAAAGDAAAARVLLAGPARAVTPDPARRILSRRETVAEHFRTAGLPLGHGYTAENLRAGTAYYAWDLPGAAGTPVRGIVLDTVNPNGESSGSIDRPQMAWLERQLEAASRRWLAADGSVRTGPGPDRLVVLFSHHPLGSLDNRIIGPDDPAPRVLGPEVEALVLRFPNVVLWVNGHTHRNRVVPHPRAAGALPAGGFVELQTAAHIDWPQQVRLVELVDNRDGTLSVFGTLVDAAAPLVPPRVPRTTVEIASLARELAANDGQERGAGSDGPSGRRGAVEDRNVELVVAAPFPLAGAAVTRPTDTTTGTGSGTGPGGALPDTGGGDGALLLGTALLGAGLAATAVAREV